MVDSSTNGRSMRGCGRLPAWLAAASIGLAGCGGDGGDAPTAPPAPTGTAIGGSITGIATGSQVTLTDNGGDAVTLAGDGTFTFPTRLPLNQTYAVAIGAVSGAIVCSVLHDRGTVVDAGPVTTVSVFCGPTPQATFKPAAGLHAPRQGHRLARLPDGTVFAFGGVDASAFVGSTAPAHATLPIERYDAKLDRWTDTAASLSTATPVQAALPVAGGRILVIVAVGNGSSNPTSTLLLFDPATGTTGPAATPSTLTRVDAAVGLLDGRVLASDGQKVEIYDGAANRWTVANPTNRPHAPGDLVVMNDGNVLYDGSVFASEIFDTRTGAWAVVGAPSVLRNGPMHVLLPGGKILMLGGGNAVFVQSNPLALGGPVGQLELFDPATRTWSPAGALPADGVDANFTATSLPSGKVLIAGGEYTVGPLANAFAIRLLKVFATSLLFDPAGNTLTPAGNLDGPRTMHATILTNEGKALVTGGYAYRPAHVPPSDTTDFAVTFATTGQLFW